MATAYKTRLMRADPRSVAAPSSLTATAVSGTEIDLAWTDNSSNESGFIIERSADGATGWAEIASAAANATSYNNTGLTAGVTYYYRVRAYGVNVASGVSNTAHDTTPILPTPVAWWKFNEGSGSTATDTEGVNDGVITAATYSADAPTLIAPNPFSLSFNGSSALVTATDTGLPAGSDIRSFSLWIKSTVTGAYQTFLAYGTPSVGAGDTIDFGFANNDQIWLENDGGAFISWVVGIAGDGLWHHFALVYDDTAWTLYLDGVSKGAQALQTNTLLSGVLTIGSFIGGVNFFAGKIDDVRIYAATLSQAQVTALVAGN